MELEKQVCSLELAERLRELGVKQESLFWWVDYHQGTIRKDLHYGKYGEGVEPLYAAFTVAELGEMLPHHVDGIGYIKLPYLIGQGKHWWFDIGKRIAGNTYTEADARATMLIYLLENKLITL